MCKVTWEEPPVRKTKHNLYELVNQLKTRPGHWAKFEDMQTVYAYAAKHGKLKAFEPAGSFDGKVSNGIVYIRYVK